MRAAVLGSPVAHSLSPVLHRAAYAHLGLDWQYDAVECDAAGLPAFVAGLGSDWAGLSLTMPLKAAVLPLLDEVDAVSAAAAAANTLLLREGRRVGANTDVPGMAGAVAEHDVTVAGADPVAVLGAGATARSAVVWLAGAGCEVVDVAARRPAAAAELVRVGTDLGVQVRVHGWEHSARLLSYRLVVATVPRGVTDELASHVPAAPGVLFDVLYDPWPTPLSAAWAAAGGLLVGGLDLLVHQAARQVQLMTGAGTGTAELVVVMRAALAAHGTANGTA